MECYGESHDHFKCFYDLHCPELLLAQLYLLLQLLLAHHQLHLGPQPPGQRRALALPSVVVNLQIFLGTSKIFFDNGKYF